MSPLKFRRTVAAMSLSALAVGGLAACGSDDSADGDTSSASSESADAGDDGAEEDASGSQFGVEEGEEVDPTEFADANVAALESVDSAALEMITTTGGTEVTMTGVSNLDPDNLLMRVESEEAGELLVVDGVMYLPQAPGSDQYLSVDLDDPSNPLGATFSVIADPEASAQAYSTAATSIVYTGNVDVEGVEVETYEATIDSATFYETLGLADLAALIDEGAIPPEFQQTVGFDGEGRLVRIEQTVPETDVVPETVSRTTYSDFGVEVDVTAPDPANVTPYAEAFAGQT